MYGASPPAVNPYGPTASSGPQSYGQFVPEPSTFSHAAPSAAPAPLQQQLAPDGASMYLKSEYGPRFGGVAQAPSFFTEAAAFGFPSAGSSWPAQRGWTPADAAQPVHVGQPTSPVMSAAASRPPPAAVPAPAPVAAPAGPGSVAPQQGTNQELAVNVDSLLDISTIDSFGTHYYYATAYYMGEQRDQDTRKTAPVKANPSSTTPGKENCVLHKQITMPYNPRQQFVLVSVYESDQVGDSFVGQATLPLADQNKLQTTAPWPLIKDGLQNGVATLNVSFPAARPAGGAAPASASAPSSAPPAPSQLQQTPYGPAPPATNPYGPSPTPAQSSFAPAPTSFGGGLSQSSYAPPTALNPYQTSSSYAPPALAAEHTSPEPAASAAPSYSPAPDVPLNLFQGIGLGFSAPQPAPPFGGSIFGTPSPLQPYGLPQPSYGPVSTAPSVVYGAPPSYGGAPQYSQVPPAYYTAGTPQYYR